MIDELQADNAIMKLARPAARSRLNVHFNLIIARHLDVSARWLRARRRGESPEWAAPPSPFIRISSGNAHEPVGPLGVTRRPSRECETDFLGEQAVAPLRNAG